MHSHSYLKAILPALVLAALVMPGFAQTDYPDIDNFEMVSPGILRGAQPSEEALADLSGRGVKSVIDLRKGGIGTKSEKKLVEQLGMHYYHIPMGYLGPPPHKVIKFLKLVLNDNNLPVFIHCRQGADRTGTMIAIYRMVVQGWSLNQVFPEMRQHHFKPWLVALKRTVENYAGPQPAVAGNELKSLKPMIENYNAVHSAENGNRMVAGSGTAASM